MNKKTSKTYKFKIEDATVTVTVDVSFSDSCNLSKTDFVSTINYQHCHPVYEMFFIKENALTLFSEGKATEYTNCALCIPPNLNHHSFRQDDHRILFSYKCAKGTGDFARFINNFSAMSQPFKLKTNPSLMQYIEDFSRQFFLGSNFPGEIAECFFKIVFYKLYELNAKAKKKTTPSAKESYLAEIENIVNYFQNDIDLKTVANALNLSTKQTSRIIVKNYQKPLSALMTEKRLSIACILLKYTNSTISEIVEFVHFPSESYFYSSFKKAYGCTPYKYKKELIKTSHKLN